MDSDPHENERLLRRISRAAVVVLLLALVGCEGGELVPDIELPEPIARDLDEILERDTLVALTTYNSTSYFLYRGQPMGYEYELLKSFAEDHDVELKMIVVQDRDSLYYKLNQGVGDVVAARVVPSAADTNDVFFTRTLYETSPAIVQREGPPGTVDVPAPTAETIEEAAPESSAVSRLVEVPDSFDLRVQLVRRPSELAGDTVHLPSNPAFVERLIELEDTTTGDIHLAVAEGEVSEETLIREVSRGAIRLAVSQANVARLRESYFTNITVKPTVGPPVRVAWAVRKNAPELKVELDEWIEGEQEDELLAGLYKKYFVDRQGYVERMHSEYLTGATGAISPYDALLQAYAPTIGWDWRLLAAQTYQESRFDPTARSWAGATGLLQLMPATARQYGVSNAYDPEENLEGAVRFLDWLQEYWAEKIPDEEERLKFILASYNAGHGHVEDARRLAEKHGDPTQTWDDVAYWMLQLSKNKYNSDPVVEYGYCRGLEPVTYVSLILERYQHYSQFATA